MKANDSIAPNFDAFLKFTLENCMFGDIKTVHMQPAERICLSANCVFSLFYLSDNTAELKACTLLDVNKSTHQVLNVPVVFFIIVQAT